jgi:HlyD family secretion protein
MNYNIKNIGRCLTACFLLSCAYANTPALNLYTVKTEPVTQTLYYDGDISPIKNVPVISTTQGVIDKMLFSYGQIVSKKQLLLHIQSSKVMSDLRDAKAAYLTALQSYNKKKNWESSDTYINAQDALTKAQRAMTQAKTTYEENQKLYQLEIISHDELSQSESAYQDSQMSYQQSQRSLKDLLIQSKGDDLAIAHLQFINAKQKYTSLRDQVKRNSIYAPAAGITLQPESGADGDSNNSVNKTGAAGKLQVGSSINYQQVLLNIGDMSGLKIDFVVPEININQIKVGQKALITGAGFTGMTLNGTVTEVGAQAKTSDGGGTLPSFPVEIKVPTLTETQQKLIRSGMDAQIAITVYEDANTLAIPVNAVSQNAKKQPIVQVYDANTKTTTPTLITTGKLTATSVQVLTGLKAGDQIVLPSATHEN